MIIKYKLFCTQIQSNLIYSIIQQFLQHKDDSILQFFQKHIDENHNKFI